MDTDTHTRGLIDRRLANHTGHLVRAAAAEADIAMRAALPSDRSPREVASLSVLADRQPMSQAELGGVLHVNRTAMIALVDGLEIAGLVRRDRDPSDRRRYALHLSESATGTLEHLYESVLTAESNLTRSLTAADHKRLNWLLQRVVPDFAEGLPASLTSLSVFLLDPVSVHLRARSSQVLRDGGMEPRCVRMLVALDVSQPCTQERLAKSMSLAAPSIVTALDELDANGLMTRTRNRDDRREQVLRLSAGGERYLADALQAESIAQSLLADELGVGDTARLNELLRAVI